MELGTGPHRHCRVIRVAESGKVKGKSHRSRGWGERKKGETETGHGRDPCRGGDENPEVEK